MVSLQPCEIIDPSPHSVVGRGNPRRRASTVLFPPNPRPNCPGNAKRRTGNAPFLASIATFLVRNAPMLVSNATFLVRNALVLASIAPFLTRNATFLVRNALFLARNAPMLVRKAALLVSNEP